MSALCQCPLHVAHRAKFPSTTPRIGWLSVHLNGGRRSGFKAGEKVKFTDGYHFEPRVGEVIGAGPGRSELLVQSGGREWILRRQIPIQLSKATIRPAQRRDALGRFTR